MPKLKCDKLPPRSIPPSWELKKSRGHDRLMAAVNLGGNPRLCWVLPKNPIERHTKIVLILAAQGLENYAASWIEAPPEVEEPKAEPAKIEYIVPPALAGDWIEGAPSFEQLRQGDVYAVIPNRTRVDRPHYVVAVRVDIEKRAHAPLVSADDRRESVPISQVKFHLRLPQTS